MVNAAVDIREGKDFYKQGDKLPKAVAERFEARDPSLLDSYIEINGKWIKIEDKNISDWVEANKTRILRLKRFFDLKISKPPKEKAWINPFKGMEHVKPPAPPIKKVITPPKKKKVVKVKPVQKYTGITFKRLTRKQQEKELKKLGIKYSPKDKERDLVKKYLKYF
jgi:hypothetical protein